MKAYSQDLRDRVIAKYDKGDCSITKLAKLFSISRHTISAWVARYKATGDYSSKQHIQMGRRRRFTDQEAIIEFLSSNPDAQGIEIRDVVAPDLPMSTFYDTLKRMGITYKKKNPHTKGEMKKLGKRS